MCITSFEGDIRKTSLTNKPIAVTHKVSLPFNNYMRHQFVGIFQSSVLLTHSFINLFKQPQHCYGCVFYLMNDRFRSFVEYKIVNASFFVIVVLSIKCRLGLYIRCND